MAEGPPQEPGAARGEAIMIRRTFVPQMHRLGQHAPAVAVVLALATLVLPLPGAALDLLLALNLAFGMAVLLAAMRSEGPTGFPVLPGVLVLGSLVRVALGVAAARAVVAHGGAGTLPQTLGWLLAGRGESLLSGMAVLGVLMLVCYLVLNVGLMRLAEVAARFTLDALPGRQMALDSALSGGRMDAEEGAAFGRQMQTDSAFYGSMDGAARFLRGEAMALPIILALIPVAGLTGGEFSGQWTDLVRLALGQGLALLVPGVLMGVAAAIVLSRGRDLECAGSSLETLPQPALLAAVAAGLLVLAAVPGMAKLPLLAVVALAGGWAWHQSRHLSLCAEDDDGPAPQLRVRLGMGLLSLTAGEALMARLGRLRLALSDELGFALPAFTVTDDAGLDPHEFALAVNGIEAMRASLWPGRLLLAEGDRARTGLISIEEGQPADLPDGRRARWLRLDEDEAPASSGVNVLDALGALELYLRAAVEPVAGELLDLQRARELLEAARATHPALTEAWEAAGLTAADLRDVGRELLAEGVPLVERIVLLEAMITSSGAVGNAGSAALAEAVRPALRRTISQSVAPGGTLSAYALAEKLQQELQAVVEVGRSGEAVALEAQAAERWRRMLRWVAGQDRHAVVLCPPQLRAAVATLAREAGAGVRVVQVGELLPLTEIVVRHVLQGHENMPAPVPATGT